MYIFLKVIQFVGSTLIWMKFFDHPRWKALTGMQKVPAFLIFFLLTSVFYWGVTSALIEAATK